MRPERPDIAAPPFAAGLDWIGGEPPVMERMCAKGPVLVHFFEASEASSVRSLDWIRGWQRAYGAHGLRVIGVHTPRSGFARQSSDLAAAVEALGIAYPVANDSKRMVWRDYGCEGWPTLFLWRRGGVLDWAHFGEGEYQATEAAIRAALGPEAAEALGPALEPARRSDALGAAVVPPSAEYFPGGSHEVPFEGGTGEAIKLAYEAGAVYVALSGSGTVTGSIDDKPIDLIEVSGPRTVAVAEHGAHGDHRIELEPGLGVRVWAIGFGAGVPDRAV